VHGKGSVFTVRPLGGAGLGSVLRRTALFSYRMPGIDADDGSPISIRIGRKVETARVPAGQKEFFMAGTSEAFLPNEKQHHCTLTPSHHLLLGGWQRP
jgi:hypothetical protein